jgi:hypothetical protein
MKTRPFLVFVAVLAGTLGSAFGQDTTFTYQGRLSALGEAASGVYSFQFRVFTAASGGSQVGATWITNGVPVTNGFFTVGLDFGPGVFTGAPRWLDLGVKSNSVVGAHTLLTPRQPLTAAPYAIHASHASIADSATTASTAAAVANNTVGTTALQNDSVTAPKIPAGQVVKSLNGLRDDVTLAVGANLTLAPSGNILTLDASADWKLSGNAGTLPGTHFVGTTDNQDLVFKVNNFETLRLTTSQDLVLPDVPQGFLIGFGGINGLGTYGQTYNTFFNRYEGRLFGNVDVDGPVLYGEGGGGLGMKYRTGIFGDLVEKLVAKWDTEEVAFYAQRGLKLQAYDGPIITRGWDPFNSSAGAAKRDLGRWGLFMEPGQLVCGIPDLDVPGEDRSFSVQKYRVDGVRTELMRVDNRNGFLMVNGVGGESAYLGGDGWGSDVQIGSLNPNIQNVAFYNGGNGQYMHVYVKALTVVGGADLAEPFAMSHTNVTPGSVVVIDPRHPGRLTLSTRAYDKKVAGVVSGAGGIEPGLSLTQMDQLEAGKNVALTGRVYVQADARPGAIEPGDLLTTSDTPGHAMKATDHARTPGAVLGKAMSALQEGQGLVLVLVTLQ